MRIFARLFMLLIASFFLLPNALAKRPPSSIVLNALLPTVCDQFIRLSTQAEVDAFECTEVIGGITISGADITNLDSLYTLKRVKGDLYIASNINLKQINGLQELTSVEGTVAIINNAQLVNLDGLSSLASVEALNESFTSIVIVDNPALISIQGLKSLTIAAGTVQIENNASLTNLDGLESLTQIGLVDTRIVSLYIKRNASLANIDGLSALRSVGGYYLGSVNIEHNPSLINLNGLSSLTTITGGYTAGLSLKDNALITNVDGLASFNKIKAAQGFIDIQDNPNLTRGCGLFTILHNSALTGFQITTTISGNGVGFTKEEILTGGSCPESTIPAQPSQLSITNVTGQSMKLTFISPTLIPSGYITLMRAYGSPFPKDAPVDGTTYQVGNTIGSSTIVVGVGTEMSFTVTSLIPNTNYYFAIFSYYEGNDYVTLDPLEGRQQSTNETEPLPSDPTVQASNLQFSEITHNSLVVSFNAPTEVVPDGYITFMKAIASPFPEDVPVSGTYYQVGDVIGSSTVVVGLGASTSFSIIWLLPGMEYFFDIYSYQRPIENGSIFLVSDNPLSGSARTTFGNLDAANHSTPYPNPFAEEITIPFTVKNDNTFVQIVVYDPIGIKVAQLTSQSYNQGHFDVKWDRTDNSGSKVKQGVYIYNVTTSESRQGMSGTVVAK